MERGKKQWEEGQGAFGEVKKTKHLTSDIPGGNILFPKEAFKQGACVLPGLSLERHPREALLN